MPLHDSNQQYDTVSTGLVKVQPDRVNKGLVDWVNTLNDPDLPQLSHPNHADCYTVNGCPLSQGAHRTYYLGEVGDYFLETSGATLQQAGDNFNVKMECSGGAKTASPAESDPLGFSVNAKTGDVSGTPKRVRGGSPYRMRLRAVDAAEARTTVAEWMFNVKQPPAFATHHSTGWNAATDGKLAIKCHVGETHLLPKPQLNTEVLLEHPANGAFSQVVYLLSAEAVGRPTCASTCANATRVVSALTDVATGEGAINIKCEGNYTASLIVRDGAGDEVTIRNWTFEALRKDTMVPEHGPGGRGCVHGAAFDGEPMDRQFTCECAGTKFTGDNCEAEAVTSKQDNTTSYIIGAAFAVLVVVAVAVFFVIKC